LRLCDQNTYASQDVSFISGNVIERHVAERSATTVIFSSVMHEVHSYTGYDVTQIDRALTNARDSLEPEGHVLIRDGVSPETARWRLALLNAQTREVFERFAKEFKRGQGVPFERLSEHEVRLSSHDANEFLCKKDYLTNWHIEVHEEFGPLTMTGWGDALTRSGFEVVHLSSYVNGWIAKHRYEGALELTDDSGRPLPWPATNVIAVGRKPR
jgi:SAM-dependent methyltransferase